MITSTDQILSAFIDAWNAGERPDVDEHLSRVEGEERERLRADLDAFLAVAPMPAYDEAALAAIRAEPLLVEALRALERPAGAWPSLLPRLRARLSLTAADVSERLASLLGLAGREAKVERYLERLEAGELEASGVSSRVVDALSRVLRVPARDLLDAGDLGRWAPAAGPAFRAGEQAAAGVADDLDLLADMAAAPSRRDWDEVDELFRGGR